MVIGLITGHCNLRYHLNKIDQDQPKHCRLCDATIEDSFHIVCSCPRLRFARSQSFGNYEIDVIDCSKWQVKQIVSFISYASIKDLLRYDPDSSRSSDQQEQSNQSPRATQAHSPTLALHNYQESQIYPSPDPGSGEYSFWQQTRPSGSRDPGYIA